MDRARAFLNHPWFFWALLSIPSVPMIIGFGSGRVTAESLLHPSGEFAARLMIIAMMLSPLRMLFPGASWLRWMAQRRRALGVAAFAYAVLHTLFYIVDMETLRAMAAEFFALGIWTGWVAMLIFVPLAITSTDGAMRRMRKWWPFLHRWVYGAAILTLIHWIFVHNNLGPALVHFVPLALLEGYRVTKHLTANVWRFS